MISLNDITQGLVSFVIGEETKPQANQTQEKQKATGTKIELVYNHESKTFEHDVKFVQFDNTSLIEIAHVLEQVGTFIENYNILHEVELTDISKPACEINSKELDTLFNSPVNPLSDMSAFVANIKPIGQVQEAVQAQ